MASKLHGEDKRLRSKGSGKDKGSPRNNKGRGAGNRRVNKANGVSRADLREAAGVAPRGDKADRADKGAAGGLVDMPLLRLFDLPLLRATLAASMHVGIVACAARLVAGENALALAVVTSTSLGAIAIFADVWAQRGDDERAEESADRWLAVATALALAAVTIGGPIEAALRGGGSDAYGIAPLFAVALGGLTLRARAIRVLGDQFVTAARVRRGDALVRHDVYALVRHPSEAGLILFTAAMAAMTGSVAATLGALGTTLVAIVRARREDATLRRAFGDTHAHYALRVGSLIPRATWSKRGDEAPPLPADPSLAEHP